jgi:hypothetical protein
MVLVLCAAFVMVALAVGTAFATSTTSFIKMLPSKSAIANHCLQGADANVKITSVGENLIMDVTLNKMPKNTAFTLFVIQVPNAPFGVSWYQGDIETDSNGHGEGRFIGIFSEEVFAVAPGSAPAPQVDDQDALVNPPFKPVHTFHLGVWFADPEEAEDAGCSETVTPFDGDHEAGIQALSTRQFPDDQGPLGKIQ